jgi:hypothetical protein
MNTFRYRCRFTRCGSNLPEPVDNHYHAFCKPNCHRTFYLNRCIVCERDLPKGPANRKTCKKAECRSDYRRFPHAYDYPQGASRNPAKSAKEPYLAADPGHPTGNVERPLETSIKSGIETRLKSERPFWRDRSGRGWRWEAHKVSWQTRRDDSAEHRDYEARDDDWVEREGEYHLLDRDGQLVAGLLPDQTGYRIFHPWPGRLMRVDSLGEAKRLAVSLALATLPPEPRFAERIARLNELPPNPPQTLVPWTAGYLEGLAKVTAEAEAPSIDPDGYVCFAEGEGSGRIMIGFSTSPDGWVEEGTTFCPYPLRVLKVISGGREEKQRWHRKFQHLLPHGEWFEDTPELRQAIDRAKPAPGFLHLAPSSVPLPAERIAAMAERAAPSIVPDDIVANDIPEFLLRTKH